MCHPYAVCVRAADVAVCYARTLESAEDGAQDTAGTKVVQTNGVKRQGKLVLVSVLLLLLRLAGKRLSA